MSKRCSAVHGRSFGAAAGFLAGLGLFATLSASPAEAWHRHHHHHRHHYAHHFRHHLRLTFHLRHMRPGAAQTTQFAALVVDGNTGHELYGRNENALRHPASITKVMTLYLLFEQIEKGRLHLDSRIPVSAHAAAQAPTKIGLRPGQTISVEDAIKAIVTQSANDIAVAVAEAIGGDEADFAAMMTRKAHALGMTRTHYANASGLPNDEQLTTAHDLAILGRAIQERFPRYYRYFSTRSFYFHGVAYHNHNHLLGHVEGIDGIKTGYTRASGFNLLTSVKRDGHFIVAVVLGGASSASRDRVMDNLIEAHIDDGATRHSAPLIAENPADERAGKKPVETAEPQDIALPKTPVAVKTTAKPMPLAGAVSVDPAQVGSLGVPQPVQRPRPAFVSAAPKPLPLEASETDPETGSAKRAVFDGTTVRSTGVTATPSTLRWVVGPAPARIGAGDAKRLAKNEDIRSAPEATGAMLDSERPAAARSGWMIQIGATDDVAKASELLARAKRQGPGSLSTAKPFTEKIQKGSETLYRARFAGLEAETAEAACRSLKRSGFACFATKN
ncbi:MAG: serine hydrolase [Methylovirgula sp.]